MQRGQKENAVGVHRSYFKPKKSLTLSELEAQLDPNHKIIQTYLRDMRVPEKVIEAFLATSSTGMSMVSDLGNFHYDRIMEEFLVAKCGAYPTIKNIPEPDRWESDSNEAWLVGKAGEIMTADTVWKRYWLDDTTRALCKKYKDWVDNWLLAGRTQEQKNNIQCRAESYIKELINIQLKD